MGIQDREHLEVKYVRTFASWLSKHHGDSPGLWVVTHKKASGVPAPTYDELVRTALCYGWIDSIPGKVDEFKTKLYFSPRKQGSVWAKTNKARIVELIDSGEMKAPGLRAIEAAKQDGSWSKIDQAEAMETPKDLTSAFRKYAGSRKNFEAFPPGVRKQIIQWITLAKTETTREKRVHETARLAAENIRANQWRDRKK